MGAPGPLADQPDHVRINREHWTRANASHADTRAAGKWGRQEIAWGLWDTPERDVRVLPDVASRDVIELGCGTAYFSAWLRRRGARRVVGIDVTPAQLETARRLDEEWALGLELIEASAEAVPLPDASFDLAVSEYGASIWCDPDRWIPEAARLLRPRGELVFMRNSTLSMLCNRDSGQVSDSLHRSQRSLSRLEWTGDDAGVEFHPCPRRPAAPAPEKRFRGPGPGRGLRARSSHGPPRVLVRDGGLGPKLAGRGDLASAEAGEHRLSFPAHNR
ncbi:MAG TPA: class I SAM-dependent methyltransferase [Candidatus Binatia bacterium]|nr:class I SAM-dependent methyltransferase [Candidatus Binatia bacterium]